MIHSSFITMITFALLLLVAVAASDAPHRCIHDDPKFQRAKYGIHRMGGNDTQGYRVVEVGRLGPGAGRAGPAEVLTAFMSTQDYGGSTNESKRRSFQTASKSPIRFVFRTEDLTKAGQYCATPSGQVPDFSNATIDCTDDTVLTAAKRNFLTQTVLPEAGALLSRYLKVTPVAGKLKVSNIEACGEQFTIPPNDVSDGVDNADFVLYVSAAPTEGSTIAWATYCEMDKNGRPVVGQANFSPKYLSPKSPREKYSIIRTAVHEIMHALGFSYEYLTSEFSLTQNSITNGTTRRGGQPVTLYKGVNALNAARQFFNCPLLDGIELEDEGGEGTDSSHWEMRTHEGEIMVGIDTYPAAISSMTLGLFADTGHYEVDMSEAETPRYMHNAGCGVIYEKCNTVAGGRDKYFCFDESETFLCTYDYTSIGVCDVEKYDANLPAWGRYFTDPKIGGSTQLFNYCPIVSGYSNQMCNDYSNEIANNTIHGFYYGNDGRCFKTSGDLIAVGHTYPDGSNPGPARCLQMRCPDGVRVEFKVGNSTWIACPNDGSAATINLANVDGSGYKGTVTCPRASEICSTTTTPTTTTPTTTKPTTTKPTTTTPTTATPTEPPISNLQMRCPDGVRIEFKVGNSTWIACPNDGSAATINLANVNGSGYNGTVTCPRASEICNSTTTPSMEPANSTSSKSPASYLLAALCMNVYIILLLSEF